MAHVLSDPDTLLHETGVDFRRVGVLTHTMLDSARSIRPILIVRDDQRYLVGHSVDKAAFGYADLRDIQPIYYGGWFSAGRPYLGTNSGLIMFPGLALILTVLAFNLVGESVQDLLDPRLER